MTEIGFHPAASLFPLIDGTELEALANDIRKHGLLDPIVLYEGKVLDGRNRLRACELAGVEPRFVEWNQDGQTPTEWVVSENLHRRHLTTGQRAALALDLLPRLEADARERQRTARPGVRGGSLLPESAEAIDSHEKAADLVGVGRSTVAKAKAIQNRDEGGDVVDQLRAGDLNVEQGLRAVGLSGTRGDVLDDGKAKPVYYGKGDKFKEAILPSVRYFRAWEKRDYRFSHLNPREARKRVAVLDELEALITAARRDLEQRAAIARLRV